MRALLFISSFFILISCREPIELNFATAEAKLVIDGFITNVEKQHSIRLTRSSGFTEGGIHVIDSISGALVEIIDDSGTSMALQQHGIGEYRTPIFKAEPGKNYKLVVRFESETYESSFQTLPDHIEETKIRFEPGIRQVLSSTETSVVDQHGINILLDLNPVDELVYYHFLQRNFFIWEAFGADGVQLPNEFCYVRGFDRLQVDLFESGSNGLEGSVSLDLDFIPASPLLEHDFSVQVVQLITNQESHAYWSAIKSQFENVGSQFDAAPNSINGNIRNSMGEPALGFFGVYNETSQRIFFNNADSGLPPNQQQEFGPCGATPVPQDPCYDCLFARGFWSRLDAPDWWRDQTIDDDDGIGVHSNFYSRWRQINTILSECADETQNGENRQVCNNQTCEQYIFRRDQSYTKTSIIAGQTTVVVGQFEVRDDQLLLLPVGGSLETYEFKVDSESLTLISQVSGCTETRVYSDE